MNYQKINKRWIYWLTLTVFGRNLVTYIVIAFLMTILGVAQAFVPLVGLLILPMMIYLGGVSFMLVHKTILNNEVVSPGEAFAITPQSKTYFWQYLMLNAIPIAIGIFGSVLLFVGDNALVNNVVILWIILGSSVASYYVLMAFFGSSLVATAVEADGMMMISRGRETFFYSLIRMIILPSLALGMLSAGGYYLLLSGQQWSIADLGGFFGDSASDAIFAIFVLTTAVNLAAILLNLITAVIVTKAFLLAEVRLAVKGEPTEWGKRKFGISERGRGVVFR